MITNATLVGFSELLFFATGKQGFDWNEAHRIMVPSEEDSIIPNHGISEIDRDEVEYKWVEGDCRTIVLGFMTENNLQYMYVYYDK